MNSKSIIKNSISIVILVVISKLLGFGRDILVASKFGASYSTDVYMFCLNIVILLFSSIGNSLNTSFIPVLSSINASKRDRERFINNLLSVITMTTIIVTIIGISAAPLFVRIFAPGFVKNPVVFGSAVENLRIMFVCIVFFGVQNILSGVLQSYGNFIATNSISIFSNIIFICYLIVFSNKFGIVGLSIATVIGFLVQTFVLIPSYAKIGYKFYIVFDFKDFHIKQIISLTIPTFIGSSIAQFSFLVDTLLATTVNEGTISILNFSSKLVFLVYGTFSVAVASVIYPKFAALVSIGDEEGFSTLMTSTVTSSLLVLLPATFGIAMLREQIVSLIFGHGAFSAQNVEQTAAVFLCLSPCIILYGIRDVLNRAFYANKDTKTPMINSIIGVCVNIAFDILLVKRYGAPGLAFATFLAAATTTLVLIFRALEKNLFTGHKQILYDFVKIAAASILTCIVIQVCLNFNPFKGNLYQNAIEIAIATTIGALSYFIFLSFMEIHEFQAFKVIFKNKLKSFPKKNRKEKTL